MPTILLLIASNVFMTIAWYWHLKGGMEKPILLVILISWSVALIEIEALSQSRPLDQRPVRLAPYLDRRGWVARA